MSELDDLIVRFKERLTPHVGNDVSVWTVRFDRPYHAGQLLRLADEGLVIAGHGIVPYDQIDKVGVSGTEIRFATQT